MSLRPRSLPGRMLPVLLLVPAVGIAIVYLRKMLEKRQNLEKNRQQMVANLVHEIGRPLGSMRTAVDALLSGALDDPALRVELVQGISERVERISRLLEDLALTYRRLARREIHLKPVIVEEWIKSLTPLWAESARQKGVGWDASVQNGLPVISTDPERLAQALSNLVNNAIKFTPPQGKVSLSIYMDAGVVRLEVRDTGPGIPLEEQSQLFTPFHRSVRPSWKAPGLGLGLSIAHSIAQSLGGRLTFTSTPGHGSTFTVELPAP